MSTQHYEILVEEQSMAEFLTIALPKELSFNIRTFQGKHNLLNRLSSHLNGYLRSPHEDTTVLIVVDRDIEDCLELKRKIQDIVDEIKVSGSSLKVVIRIVIEELEAWYFGDWQAVIKAFPKADSAIPRKAKYRNPDNIKGGTWETFEKILQRAGYYPSGLMKTNAARSIAPYIDLRNNSSKSCQVFVKTILAK